MRPARRPRSRPRPRVGGRGLLQEQALVGAISLQRCAPAARRRAASKLDRTPLPVLDRADSGPLAAFSSLRSIGMITRSVPPRSSRRNAVIGPTAARSRNLRCAAIPRGAVLSCSPRGRHGGCAAPGAVVSDLCCGPRYAAIWRAQARTISRRLAAVATRPSATAPRRLGLPGIGCRLRDVKSEIRNPKLPRFRARFKPQG
jgi:hypothetical protein